MPTDTLFKCARCGGRMFWEDGLTPDTINYVTSEEPFCMVPGEVIGEGEWHHFDPAFDGSDHRLCPDGEIGYPAPSKQQKVVIRAVEDHMDAVRLILDLDWHEYDDNQSRVFAALCKLLHNYCTGDITQPSRFRMSNMTTALEALAENVAGYLDGSVNPYTLRAEVSVSW